VKAAVAEASEALDDKGADGIVIESNHHGMYLGDPKLEPFYKALDGRKAVLFVHPTSPKCRGCSSLTLGYPEPMLEFMFETTRTITNMILSGVTLRYPNIRVIVPMPARHCLCLPVVWICRCLSSKRIRRTNRRNFMAN